MEVFFKILIMYLIIINIITFLMYMVDKLKAKFNRWRIPEATLWLFAFIGGSIGAILGMQVFRHKTQKLIFKVVNFGSLILHVVILVFLAMNI